MVLIRKFSVRLPRRDYLHSIVNIAPGTPLIGYIGRLSPEKGPEVFIQVAGKVHKKWKIAILY